MPAPSGSSGSPTGGSARGGPKVTVYAGVARVKRRKPDGSKDAVQVPVLLNVRKAVAEKLNFPLATTAQMEKTEGEKEIYYDGTFHGRTVIVPDPTGAKTPKGAVKTYSFKVPSYATRKVLRTFFANTKVERFRFAGGRSRSVGKA
ncbi:MAG: hypothetical protein ACPL4I_11150 [Bacteroidota bacterium]